MTLNDLIYRAAQISHLLISGAVPVRMNGRDVSVSFTLSENENGLYADMKIDSTNE